MGLFLCRRLSRRTVWVVTTVTDNAVKPALQFSLPPELDHLGDAERMDTFAGIGAGGLLSLPASSCSPESRPMMKHLLLALMLCLTACSQSPQKLIVGTWTLKSPEGSNLKDGAIVHQFFPNGTVISTGSAVEEIAESMTYSFPDDKHLKMVGAFGLSYVFIIKSLTSKELCIGIEKEGYEDATLTFVRK
jgi:hypothetical protein